MKNIKISEVKDKDFGKCVVVENGICELWVTVDFGPRIIHYSLTGRENILYQDREKQPLGEPMHPFGDDVFTLYGGHRLWASPEILPRCYAPDNGAVTYKEVPGGMEFVSAPNKTSVQKSFVIMMDEDTSDVEIVHRLYNDGMWDIELAPWAITQLAAGGTAVIPADGPKTGLLPNRHMVFWDYTNLGDKRLILGKDYIMLKQDAAQTDSLKFGLFNHSGYAAYFVKEQLFVKHFEAEEGIYPDNGCNFECYANAEFLESESLGELCLLEPGESTVHTERWQIFDEKRVPDLERDVKEILDGYIK